MIRWALVVVALASSAAWAGDKVLSIKTRDGRVLTGRVLSETEQGYLLRTDSRTELVAYANVDDLQTVSAPTVGAASELTPVNPSYQSTMAPSAGVSLAAEPHVEPYLARRGLHLGFGVQPTFFYYGDASPLIMGAAAQFHMELALGRVDIRFSPQLGFWQSQFYYTGVSTVQLAFEATARINLASFFSLGVGTNQGLAIGFGESCYRSACVVGTGASFFMAPVMYPAIFKFGEGGMHQVSLGLMFLVSLVPTPQATPYPFISANYSAVF